MSEYLTQWEQPPYYGGFSPDGDYVVCASSKASPLLDRVNFDVASERLGLQTYNPEFYGRPFVYAFRASHFAVGWVEYLMVRCDAPDSIIREAEEIVCSLADYPVLDDEAYSDAEHDAVADLWQGMDLRERIELCADKGDSIMAARHPFPFHMDVCEALRVWVNE